MAVGAVTGALAIDAVDGLAERLDAFERAARLALQTLGDTAQYRAPGARSLVAGVESGAGHHPPDRQVLDLVEPGRSRSSPVLRGPRHRCVAASGAGDIRLRGQSPQARTTLSSAEYTRSCARGKASEEPEHDSEEPVDVARVPQLVLDQVRPDGLEARPQECRRATAPGTRSRVGDLLGHEGTVRGDVDDGGAPRP